jgi:prevent-host-death family protein
MRPPLFISASDFQRRVGEVIWQVMTGPRLVIVTNHHRPVVVVISKPEYDEYCRLLAADADRQHRAVDSLPCTVSAGGEPDACDGLLPYRPASRVPPSGSPTCKESTTVEEPQVEPL